MASEKMRPGAKSFWASPKGFDIILFPNGTGTPTYRTSVDAIASVARGATGLYTVTLKEGYHTVANAHATYHSNVDNEDIYAQGGTLAPLGSSVAPTVYVKLKTAANNVDVTADAGKFISLSILFEDEDTVVYTG